MKSYFINIYILILLLGIFLFSSCLGVRNRGFAVDFRTKLDPKRFECTNDGWAVDFRSQLNPLRFNRVNDGWAVDFRSGLDQRRYQRFNTGFAVSPRPSYAKIELSGSFNVRSKKAKGGFEFNEKSRRVKAKRTSIFNRKPVTNDSFGRYISKREYNQQSFDKKKKRVVRRKSIFMRKREKPHKRPKNIDGGLFPFDVRGNT